MTNHEKIKAMSVEELAELMMADDKCPPVYCPPNLMCRRCWIEWLESEVDT